MGYTTDFLGHINVSPPLNHAEQQYLQAFASSRRCVRPGGPYEVPLNPAAEPDDVDARNAIAEGQPSRWCDWEPCWDGCCIAPTGREKFYGATEWLAYLINHFLGPRAHAATSGLAWFDDFTFDHVLDGMIAASRRDIRHLYLIRVERNRVREQTLVPGASEWPEDLLPYEKAIDDELAARRRRRRGA